MLYEVACSLQTGHRCRVSDAYGIRVRKNRISCPKIIAYRLLRLQIILLSHFYLNLVKANRFDLRESSGAASMSDLRFSRVVGSLAGSLAYGEGSSGQEPNTEDDPGPHDAFSNSRELEFEGELATIHEVKRSLESSGPVSHSCKYMELLQSYSTLIDIKFNGAVGPSESALESVLRNSG